MPMLWVKILVFRYLDQIPLELLKEVRTGPGQS